MVVTKVFQIKNSNKLKQGLNYIDDIEKTKNFVENDLGSKLDYITDLQKTKITNDEYNVEFFVDKNGNKEMVSIYGLASVRFAYDEMMMTKLQSKEFMGDRSAGKTDVLAHHIIQSFSPDDNLTPEEVHEIGRRTVLELTGGEHEFVIATHLDKEHLHNHIIFNTTNNVTLKKFRWQKGTKKSLENISDKHADMFGAKIIDRDKIIDHKKYEAYKKQNTFRYELKDRLNFLLKNSNSLDDFIEKAQLLNIEIDITGKEIKYKLKDTNQVRYIRENTLSKKGYYSLDNIIKMTQANSKKIKKEEINKKYEDYKKTKEENFEIRFIIEDWQVISETKRGIYIEVDFGISSKGLILIPYQKLEKLESGYEAFIKRNDYFYFTNSKNAQENNHIKGTTLAKQLSKDNKEQVIYKNYYVAKLDKLLEEFNYLSKNNLTGYEVFKQFQDNFKIKLEEVESELNRLDKKIAELNKIHSALLVKNNSKHKILSEEILTKLNIQKEVDIQYIEKLLIEVRLERDILHKKFNEIIKEHKYTKGLSKNAEVRKNNRRMK